MKKITILTILLLVIAAGLRAQGFVIKQYEIDIDIHPDGYFDVEERIEVDFEEPHHGIYRDIPLRYNVDGERTSIDIDDVQVENWRDKTSRNNGNLRIRIGDPDRYVEGRQDYVIRYRVRDAWLFMEDHTEFYWNLVGTEWEAPIEQIDYEIQLREAPPLDSTDFRVFTGARGERAQDATIEYQSGELRGESTRAFRAGEGLTVAIKLPVDYIHRPSPAERFLQNFGLAGIPLAVAGYLIWLFRSYGKEEDFVEMVHFYPPDNMPPAEAGAFIDDKVHNRDLIALIPYWAGQGLLEMTVTETTQLLIISKTDYELTKLKDLPADRPQYERIIFDGLFESGDRVKLSEFKNQFYKTMSRANRQLRRSVRERELYTSTSYNYFRLWLPLLAVGCVVAGTVFLFFAQIAAGVGMLLVAIAILILRRPMLKKNKKGLGLYRQLHGFRMFIDQAETPRLKRLLEDDPAYFEKTLPYAVAFNMVKDWTGKFDGLFTEPPRWYHAYPHTSSGRGSFHNFAEGFDTNVREIQGVFMSTPASSGGSGGGFSGGSSGGGFGGGGGGGW